MARKKMLNPPYDYITWDKEESLDSIMTLKEALDLWWNSVRLTADLDQDGEDEHYLLYKDCYGDYNLNGLDERFLNLKIKLDDHWEEDSDGYPIVFAWEAN